MVFRW